MSWRGRSNGCRPPSPYRHFIAQLQARFDAAATAEFFRARLADIDEPTAPFGLLDVHGDGQHILEASQPVTPALAVRLRQQSRRLGLSPAALFMPPGPWWSGAPAAATASSSAAYCPVACKARPGPIRALGMFINTLPLRFDLAQGNARTLVRSGTPRTGRAATSRASPPGSGPAHQSNPGRPAALYRRPQLPPQQPNTTGRRTAPASRYWPARNAPTIPSSCRLMISVMLTP